ncbi:MULTISPECIES: outer membrane beta-barrel protein [unclassified Saccharicrinis]|uniref:outer membrane beta-barrel protein n=1 Tax=unclassified Saccharicrinis TaxID=2646859 RepID=UPI003D32E6DE
MKKLFLFVAISALFSTLSTAQLNSGKLHISGASDLTFTSTKMRFQYDGEKMGDEVSNKNFNLSPTVGYFAVDNFAIGLSLTYEYDEVEDYKTTTSIVGPYAIYYIGSSNVRPYLRADFGIGTQTEKEEGSDEFNMDVFAYDFGGGVAVFLNDFVSLDFGLVYAHVAVSDSDDSKAKLITDGIGVLAGLSVYF